jgi:hypothetical protein
MFVPGTGAHETFALPPAPGPEFKYGFSVEDLYFTKQGDSAVVYMHGFLGGRTWETVAYHLDLARRRPPALLFRQPGHPLHTSARGTVRAVPKNPGDACEHNFCHPLGAVIAWEISGATASKRVLLDGNARKEVFSRVQPVGAGRDSERVAVLVDEHPKRRHLLRWRWGEPAAFLAPVPSGPTGDAEAMWISASGDVVEIWIPEDRSLEIRRHLLDGKTTTSSLAPLPRRTPRDRPLFHIAGIMERENGDLFLHWGEYLILLPRQGPARRLDLRTAFKRRSEISSRLLHVRLPEGVWVGIESGKNLDMTFLPQADLEGRMTPAP